MTKTNKQNKQTQSKHQNIKKINHRIISLDVKKNEFGQYSTIHDQKAKQPRNGQEIPQMIKSFRKKCTANTIF